MVVDDRWHYHAISVADFKEAGIRSVALRHSPEQLEPDQPRKTLA